MTIVIEDRNDDNLLTPERMDIMYDIWNSSFDVILDDYKGKTWTFEDVCAKQFESYPICTSKEDGLFSYFGFNPQNWANQTRIQETIDNNKLFLDVCSFFNIFLCFVFVQILWFHFLLFFLFVFSFCVLFAVISGLL